MLELTRRLVWFFIVAAALAYAVFLLGGNAIQSEALDQTRIVLVRDHLEVGEHRLSGMVMVPSTCKQLSVRTSEIKPHVIHLAFTTWDEPNITCIEEDTPRAFRAVVFAPSVGVEFTATLDEEPLQLSIHPVTEIRN